MEKHIYNYNQTNKEYMNIPQNVDKQSEKINKRRFDKLTKIARKYNLSQMFINELANFVIKESNLIEIEHDIDLKNYQNQLDWQQQADFETTPTFYTETGIDRFIVEQVKILLEILVNEKNISAIEDKIYELLGSNDPINMSSIKILTEDTEQEYDDEYLEKCAEEDEKILEALVKKLKNKDETLTKSELDRCHNECEINDEDYELYLNFIREVNGEEE